MGSRVIYPCGCASCGDIWYHCSEHSIKEHSTYNIHDDDEVTRDGVVGLGSRYDMPIKIRKFETGATRDTDTGKLDYEGFNNALVEKRFAEYMHTHRVQPDGKLRDSDNWQKGIPKDAYMKSMLRHVHDLWLHYDGFPEEAVDKDIESVLSAIRFNVDGMLYEILKEKKQARKNKDCKVCPPDEECQHLKKIRDANNLEY